jgi:hypothetical protein
MAGWEEELALLLRNLGVTQEEPSTHRRARRCRSGGAGIHRSNPSRDAFPEEDLLAETAFLEGSEEAEEEDEEAWLEDLDEMRREVDTIVSQVIHLMQRGELEKSLKEDVLIVLRALRRSQAAQQAAGVGDEIDNEEAYLESAASMLHFCRLVLRLSEVASQD